MKNAVKRVLVVALGVILQFGFEIMIRVFFYNYLGIITTVYSIVSISIVLGILKNSTRLSKDIPWIILILVFPIFGSILLIILEKNCSKNKLLKNIFRRENEYKDYLIGNDKINQEIDEQDLDNIKYLTNRTNYFVSSNNEITYYDFGEKFYPELLKELKKAEKFIFMEYFIIHEGVMWNSILEILKQKAAQGVDVRIMYDDMGSIAVLATNYAKQLSKYGIKCIPFNKLSPFKGIFMNNRDHRKMTIIDGKVAFSGGVNLSDEYINLDNRLGIWKDNGIKIVGDAIWNLTVMFLTLWNANINEDKDINQFKYEFPKNNIKNGYVIPYGVAPFHEDLIGEDVYINMINSAKKYLYIMTPYLIIDTDMVNTLCRAAKRGIDVRIIVPGIPDKKIVYTQTISFFKVLHDNGVKIYRFNGGFVHSKVFLSDDIRAVVGTINMDYRSLYLHFENGIYMEKVDAIKDIYQDFIDTFEVCQKLDDKNVKVGFIKSIWQAILRLFAPLF